MKPRNDYVVVTRLDGEKVSPGGILIPDSVQKKANKGKVLSFGPGRWNQDDTARVASDLHVGDVVYFSQYAGNEIEENGDKFLFLRADEIMATD